MRTIVSLVLALFVGNVVATDLTGVYSNNASGFQILTLIVHENGYALMHGPVGNQIGKWKFDTIRSVLSIEMETEQGEESSFDFVFDSNNRTYRLMWAREHSTEIKGDELKLVSDTIPDEIVGALNSYPEQMIQARKAQKQNEERREEYEKYLKRKKEKLEKERPIYEDVRSRIRNNPEIVLSEKLYLKKSGPIRRALLASFNDESVVYSEKMLLTLLEELPPEDLQIKSRVFSQPSLSAESISRYFPQVLTWKRENYYYLILENIAKHENTPKHIIERIATADNIPVGIVYPARKRLARWENSP